MARDRERNKSLRELKSMLYNAMIDTLVTIQQAVVIRQNQPDKYARMLARTTQQVQDPFVSAERFANDYWSLYDRAITVTTDTTTSAGTKAAELT